MRSGLSALDACLIVEANRTEPRRDVALAAVRHPRSSRITADIANRVPRLPRARCGDDTALERSNVESVECKCKSVVRSETSDSETRTPVSIALEPPPLPARQLNQHHAAQTVRAAPPPLPVTQDPRGLPSTQTQGISFRTAQISAQSTSLKSHILLTRKVPTRTSLSLSLARLVFCLLGFLGLAGTERAILANHYVDTIPV